VGGGKPSRLRRRAHSRTGMGVGNFFARIPDHFHQESELFGSRRTPQRGAASLLYPDAKILVQPFEDTRLPNNSFDLIIGNLHSLTSRLPIPNTRTRSYRFTITSSSNPSTNSNQAASPSASVRTTRSILSTCAPAARWPLGRILSRQFVCPTIPFNTTPTHQ